MVQGACFQTHWEEESQAQRLQAKALPDVFIWLKHIYIWIIHTTDEQTCWGGDKDMILIFSGHSPVAFPHDLISHPKYWSPKKRPQMYDFIVRNRGFFCTTQTKPIWFRDTRGWLVQTTFAVAYGLNGSDLELWARGIWYSTKIGSDSELLRFRFPCTYFDPKNQDGTQEMDVWKIVFPFNRMIFRFHMFFLGCISCRFISLETVKEDSDVTVDSHLSLNCIDQLTGALVFTVYFLLGIISGRSPCDQQRHAGCFEPHVLVNLRVSNHSFP